MHVAHHAESGPAALPKLSELHAAITTANELWVKFNCLLTAEGYATLQPTLVYDWKIMFRIPWIGPESPVLPNQLRVLPSRRRARRIGASWHRLSGMRPRTTSRGGATRATSSVTLQPRCGWKDARSASLYARSARSSGRQAPRWRSAFASTMHALPARGCASLCRSSAAGGAREGTRRRP